VQAKTFLASVAVRADAAATDEVNAGAVKTTRSRVPPPSKRRSSRRADAIAVGTAGRDYGTGPRRGRRAVGETPFIRRQGDFGLL
jgi:hypothetical protein